MKAASGLFGTAHYWHLMVDLGKQLEFLHNIPEATLRSDIMLVSGTSKQLILLKLTVPWVERMKEANGKKPIMQMWWTSAVDRGGKHSVSP